MDCNNVFDLQTLLAMSVRVAGVKNVIDTQETAVPDPCAPYLLCDGETIFSALGKLFIQKDTNCYGVKIVTVAGACNPYFTCDNTFEDVWTALGKSLTPDAAGGPVLRMADTFQETDLTCDNNRFWELMKGVFEVDVDGCVSVRGISGVAIDADCNSIQCDQGGLQTLLMNSIAFTGGLCPAFFFGNSPIIIVPNPTISDNNNQWVCAGDDLTLTASGFAYDSYQWYRNNVLIGGAINSTYLATLGGTYKVVGIYNSVGYNSADYIITLQSNIPVPVITNNMNSSNSYFESGTLYVASNTPEVRLYLSDNYPGGYPPGTTIEIDGYLTPQVVDDFNNDANNYNLVSSQSNYTIRVCLPPTHGSCCAEISLIIDFNTANNAQVAEYLTTTCDLTVPHYPNDAKCGWVDINDRCVANGEADWVREMGCYDPAPGCGFINSETLTINVVDNLDGTWTLSTTGITNCEGFDLGSGSTWYDLLNGAQVLGNGLMIVVDHPGVFGFNGDQIDCLNPNSGDSGMCDGSYFLIFVN